MRLKQPAWWTRNISCGWIEPLPIPGQSRVRVIVLVPEAEDISEAAWAKAVSASPAFDFLKDAAEDVYTAADGKPFHDQG